MTPLAFAPPRGCIRTALDMSIMRHPDPDSNGMSKADAVWPQRLRRIIRAGLIYWGRTDLVETAELLITELATNALQHAGGRDIGVRVYLQGDHCVIEVNDGSPNVPVPRCAGPDDESGRGLLLVDSLAEAWGVSEDGTTTWCKLPLTEGPPDMEPAAETAQALREIPLELPADTSAMQRARVNGRTLLTLLGWPGRQHAAMDVLYVLVHNAVQHGLTPGKTGQGLSACFRVTEANELHIEVTDPNPAFDNFERALAGELGRGLWGAQKLGATITYFPADGLGKTVRATMQPGQVEL